MQKAGLFCSDIALKGDCVFNIANLPLVKYFKNWQNKVKVIFSITNLTLARALHQKNGGYI